MVFSILSGRADAKKRICRCVSAPLKKAPRGELFLFIQAYIFNKIVKFTAAADEVYKIALEAVAVNGVGALIAAFITDEYGV